MTKPTADERTLGELIAGIQARTTFINPKYQRSGEAWPRKAKSFLVETILLGMPIPPVLLHKLTQARGTVKEDIIDGQQRCEALQQFREGKFALTKNIDTKRWRGKRWKDLSLEIQGDFTKYLVGLDIYQNVDYREIRDVFRRLNYYTAPLNAAEQRHARFTGEVSDFLEDQRPVWHSLFNATGTFKKRQFDRRRDVQLLTEILEAMVNGISTAKSDVLEKFFEEHDPSFPQAESCRKRLADARDYLAQTKGLEGTSLTKPYQLFSMLLAIMHSQHQLPKFKATFPGAIAPCSPSLFSKRIAPLAELLEVEEASSLSTQQHRWIAFYRASAEGTNVSDARTERFLTYLHMLTGVPKRDLKGQ
jgi:hypothetical protein